MRYKFRLGQIVTSPGVKGTLSHSQLIALLQQHASGDWPSATRDTNEQALRNGSPVFSQFVVDRTQGMALTVWVLTDEARSKTLVMFPSESAHRASDLEEVPGPLLHGPLLPSLFSG